MKTKNVIRHFGTKTLVAKALGITKPAVGKWGKVVPELRQFQLEVITQGALKSDFTLLRIQQGVDNGMSSERQQSCADRH